ncbi:MAG: Hypothetical protein AJITA_00790 [Acetilactobacillus jinshanensis]
MHVKHFPHRPHDQVQDQAGDRVIESDRGTRPVDGRRRAHEEADANRSA